jgi:outer membrane protein TolC
MARAHRAVVVLAFAALGFAGPALAQDGDQKPPEKAPEKGPENPTEKPPELAVPFDPDAPIVPAEQLARVRAELERIEMERKKLATTEATLQSRRRELEKAAAGQSTSPVLFPRRVVLPISVADAVRRALENNPDLVANALAADQAQEGIPTQEAVFDPQLSATGQWQSSNSPNLSNNSFSGLPLGLSNFRNDNWSFNGTLQKLFETGTTAKLTYGDGHDVNNNLFAVNPTYGPKLRGDLTQSLLKNFFPNPLAVNNALTLSAQDDAAAADALYEGQLMDAVLQVETSYWDIVRAEENLKASESSLKSANELLSDRKKRKELGAGTGLDVTIAAAGVASRRESLVIAENDVETKRDALIRLTEPNSNKDRYDLFIVPVQHAELTPEQDDDVSEAVKVALARRPDYRRGQLQVDSARQQAVYYENQALPELDAFAFIEEDGVGQSSRSSWSTMGSGRFYTAGGGVKLLLPLFLRAERAQARRAKLVLQQTEAALQSLESEVLLEVRRSIRNIRTVRARIEATRTARILSEKELAAVRAEVRFGVSLPQQVLDAQATLDQARTSEIQALVDYQVALRTLERAKGTILDPYSDKLPPRLVRTAPPQH